MGDTFIPFVRMRLGGGTGAELSSRDLMRADGDVDFLPVAEVAVEFGRARREDEQIQAALLAGRFEVGGKLRAAIDLDGADGKRHTVLQSVEELGSGLSGGAGVRLQHVP